MAYPQPICGKAPAPEGHSLSRSWEWIIAAGGIIGGIITAVKSAGAVVEFIQAFAGIVSLVFGYSAWTVAGALAAVGGALLGAAIGLGIVFSIGLDRLNGRPGTNRCYGGIVQAISLAFTSGWDWAFPYGSQHDRVDVVVKQTYWPLVDARPAGWVWCADDSRMSPLIRSYFQTRQVRHAVNGAMAGAVVGAVGGAIAGYFAGVAVAAAIAGGACAASLWFYLLCLLFVIVVALIVALVCTLVTASIGGAMGAGATTNPGAPAGSGPSPRGQDALAITLGDYITLNANVTIYGEDHDAWVGWWVDETTTLPALHGRSTSGEGAGGTAPFTFTDADTGFTDACPMP